MAGDSAASAGSDAAYLDDVQFMPGAPLTVEGTPGNDVYDFDASSSTIVVALNGGEDSHLSPPANSRTTFFAATAARTLPP